MKDYLNMGMYIIYPLSFIYSIKYTRNKSITYSMRGFYWYPAVGLALAFLYVMQKSGFVSFNFFARANMMSIIFHYCFLAKFISASIHAKKFIRTFMFLYYFFLGVTIFAVIITIFVMSYRGLSLSVANIGLVVLSLFYYNSLFDEENTSDLYKEPPFWVITGTVLGMSLNIPFQALENRITVPFQNYLFEWIAYLAISGFYIMHLFFIKASLLCSVQTLEK